MNTHTRHWKRAALTSTLAMIVACGSDNSVTRPDPSQQSAARLKEIVIDRLPSPYYHFDYDDATGRITAASYSGGFGTYQVSYTGDRIDRMTNTGAAALDHIKYHYGASGQVDLVQYVDKNGATFTLVEYTYTKGRLTGVERSQRVTAGMIVDRTIALAYGADGNLATMTEHRLPIEGVQSDATSITRFEDYDSGINVDGFSVIHNEPFDHLVLLPGVQLQKNNPRKETRSGDGVNYTVTYTYGYYTDGKRPLTKIGDLLVTSGSDAGVRVQTGSVFTYY